MAWISVDQKLIGGKLRSLYKAIGCSQNEAIGILVSLWLWGIDNAEMDGLMVSADREDIKGAFQGGLSKELDGDTVVECLIETGWIDEVDGQLYLHDWEDWRSYYNRYVREKEGQAARMRRYREKRSGENAISDVSSDVTSDVTANEPAQKKAPSQKEDKYGKEFEAFWSVYPRKVDKGQAFKHYKARRNDGYSAEELLAAADNYRKHCERSHTDKQYIKHAKTFLGSSLSFTDFLPKQQTEPEPETAPASGIRSL